MQSSSKNISGFDITAMAVVGMIMISKYLNNSTVATKLCTLSASSAPAVWLHGYNCDTSTRCCNHMVMSNPGKGCLYYTTVCVAHSNNYI